MGSPDLKPETSESWELGLYYMGEEGWLEGVESSVTVFRNDVKDRISISRTSDVNAAPGYQNFVGFETGANGRRIPVFSYYNVNKARIQGVETELKIPFNDEWKLSINYTYNDGRDVSNGENKPLSDLPFHTANGTLDCRWRWKTGHSMFLVTIPGRNAPTARRLKHRAVIPSGIPARPGR